MIRPHVIIFILKVVGGQNKDTAPSVYNRNKEHFPLLMPFD
jgi:hypothetical protein